jgi:hypothetical protein
MKCLTNTEQNEWLTRRAIVERPYGTNEASKHYVQFYSPKNFRGIESFTHHLSDLFLAGSEALLVFEDWPFYQPYEMRLVDHVRSAFGEKRNLIDAPGHLFTAEEGDDLIGLFSLGVAFEWTSYLYFAKNKATVLNWEGVIFDFWTEDERSLDDLLKLMGDFKLEKTKNQKRNDRK